MSDPAESTPNRTVPPSAPVVGGVAVSVRRDAGVVILAVTGEIDALTAPEVGTSARSALAEQPAVLVFDLTEVAFLGSAGLSMLLATHNRAVPPTEVRVVAATRTTRRPIELTGLDRELVVYASLSDALGTP